MIPSLLTIALRVRQPRLFALLVLIVVVFSSFACAKRSRSVASASVSPHERQNAHTLSKRININTASAKELEALPGVGKGLAERIIEHRQKYGPFAKPEHVIMVRGISEHRFLLIRDQITIE